MINISKLDYLLRPAPFYPVLQPLLEQSALRQWHKTQKPPAPLPVKAQIIQRKCRHSSHCRVDGLLSAEVIKHVILIDDARLFGIARDYPSISAIEELVQFHRARCKMSVEMDIVRLEPGLA